MNTSIVQKNTILTLSFIFLFSIAHKGWAKQKGKEKKPNVIFLLFDDMGFSDLSCYGAKKVKTPNIDRLANEGVQFTNFLTGSSICTPSRACYLTGAYPQRCGSYMGINENREEHWFLGLNPNEITLAEQFKKQDYTTLMIGKWHLGTEEKFSYFHQGFDHYYGAPSNFGHNPIFYDEKEVVYENTPIEKLTELYTKRAVKYIEDHKNTPFFMYYAHNYPHLPYKAGAAFTGSSEDGVRGDVIQELDWGVGELIKALEENKILDNTVIVIASDNGPVKNEYAQPYRGTKYVTFEGGHRVPFIVYSKSLKRKGKTDTQVYAMDLFPTLSDMIDEPLEKGVTYDGVSLLPLLNKEDIKRPSGGEAFYYYNGANLQAVRLGNWKLHLPREKEQLPFWDKNKAFLELTKPVLYDLSTDIAEENDVASEHPDIVSKLSKLADDARLRLGEHKKHGSEQRPTGSIYPDVPVVVTKHHWLEIPYEQKKPAVDNFVPKKKPRKKAEGKK